MAVTVEWVVLIEDRPETGVECLRCKSVMIVQSRLVEDWVVQMRAFVETHSQCEGEVDANQV